MQTKVIILVTDRDDDKHGEISVVEDTNKAKRLVETLIEAGFKQERIRVFGGDELNMQVSQRPVVSLASEGNSGEGRLAEDRLAEVSLGEERSGEVSDVESEEPAQEADGTEAAEEDEVRFSSLFRKD